MLFFSDFLNYSSQLSYSCFKNFKAQLKLLFSNLCQLLILNWVWNEINFGCFQRWCHFHFFFLSDFHSYSFLSIKLLIFLSFLRLHWSYFCIYVALLGIGVHKAMYFHQIFHNSIVVNGNFPIAVDQNFHTKIPLWWTKISYHTGQKFHPNSKFHCNGKILL